MNKHDRKQAEAATILMQKAAEILRDLSNSEQEKIDNLPENMQDTDQANIMQDFQSACETAADNLENDISELESIINN